MEPITDPKLLSFANRLRKVYKHRAKIAARLNVQCFRVYDHDLPEAPLAIDLYNGAVHVAEYRRRHGMEEEAHEAWLDSVKQIISDVLGVEEALIYVKIRQRKAGREGQYEKFAAQKTERIVPEAGLSFIINLTDYLDTGLFLDHRDTRAMLREKSAGKRVLNLFCYTGSFSVYAAAGGAAQVVSVDLSNTYINWAKRNMQYNKLYKEAAHFFVQDDVLEWIKAAPADSFDLIICDPPTFSNSKRMDAEFDVQRDHVPLLKRLLKLLSDDGEIIFSNNYTNFVLDRDALPASVVQDITPKTIPFDFEGKLRRACFLIRK